MDKINLKLCGIRAEELSFKQNNIKLTKDVKLDLKPAFSKRVRTVNENKSLHFVTLEVKIETDEQNPKPFNLKVSLTGIFEAEINSEDERKELNVQAEKILYPYLRTAVSTLTSNAFVSPLILPVISGSLFKEQDKKSIDEVNEYFS